MVSATLRHSLILACLVSVHTCSGDGEMEGNNAANSVLRRGTPDEAAHMKAIMTRIAERLDTGVQKGEFTAAQALVAHHGNILLERAFGVLSRAQDAPATATDSPFLVASITKPITATAIMILVDRGFVGLNDPVQRYFPEFTGGDRAHIRVSNLLNHTSGLPDMLPENQFLRRKNSPLKDFVPLICNTPLLFAPGSKVQYQSLGIALLGEIVERVTGLPLREFLKREVFDPLGMHNTFLGAGGRELESLVQCDVPVAEGDAGYERWDWNSLYWRDLGAPWGGMHSTAGDLAVFLQTVLNEGAYDGVRILRPSTARDMLRNQAEGMNLPWAWGWALPGSWEERYFGDSVSENTFGHVGVTGTVAWADPERDLIFICLTTRPLDQDTIQLFRGLSDLVTEAVKKPRDEANDQPSG